ncbi:MAG: hypothetical protein V1824_01680 [archaeon]
MNIYKLKIFLIFLVIISLISLLFASYFYTPQFVSLDKLYSSQPVYLEKSISTSGSIRSLSFQNNMAFFDICQGYKCIPSIIFNVTNNQKEIINTYTKVKVIGRLTNYKNKNELIIYKIESFGN